VILYSDDRDEINTILDTIVARNNKTVIVVPSDDDIRLFQPYFLRVNANKEDMGDRIRGTRAMNIIFYKANEINLDVHHHILRGYAATSSDPIKKLKEKDVD
jgi:hypothetical protein